MEKDEFYGKKLFFIIIILVCSALTPVAFYACKFHGYDLSEDNLHWAQFGTFLSGTLSPVIALTGAVLTFTLGYVSYRHNQTVIKKQEREKRPLINVSYQDMDDEITITLRNKGLGPLIITSYKITNEISNEDRSSVFDWIKLIPCEYGYYTGDLSNNVLKDGEEQSLLVLKGEVSDPLFIEHRDRLRKLLGQLLIKIDYKDIYDTQMPTYIKSFSWFKRNDFNSFEPRKALKK